MEYLLLHAFNAKKYIVPDKISAYNKELTSAKHRINAGVEGEGDDDLIVNDGSFENDGQHIDQWKGKKGRTYSGGFVLIIPCK